MNKLTRLLLYICLVVMAAGCSPSKPTTSQPAQQTIRYNIGAEPATLDPALSSGVTEQTLENALLEGLVRMDRDGKPSPGMAKSWEVSADGRIYTFTLRESNWTNGEPLTAEDFVYSWRRVLDPETASPYAYQLYYLVNGEAFNAAKIKDPAEVGVRAEGKDKLIVTLNEPVPYFLSLTAFPTLFPVNKKAVEGDSTGWAQNPATFTGNGPFKLTTWEHNKQFILEKNEHYWDQDSVQLKSLVVTLVDDANTELAMFESGQIDIAETPPYREMERLAKDNLLKLSPDLSNEFYMFNTNLTPFNDVRVRQALSLAIDREALVSKVTLSGEKAAYAFVPPGVNGPATGSEFRSLGEKLIAGFNPSEAKKLLAEAGYPEGRGFPKVKLLISNNQNHRFVAEAITGMWQESLGIEAEIIEQEYKVFYETLDERDYQVARVGWNADYNDPMTFLDLWEKAGPNNQADWTNEGYDRLLKQARETKDSAARMDALFEAEKILMSEQPLIPIYYYTNPYLEKDNIREVIHPSFAFFADFKWAFVD
ncbi:MAG: peptide ABC transporter substrate-binding protein [Desulfotomaculaceae bacterium]|nr:peptide ABC transporter substrate-binding protein [Desulfotomaculaceae bacterium]